MIVTLTPNPSLDLLFRVGRLVWEDANRTAPPRRRAGGQGINVVRAIRALDPGAEAVAIAPLGGPVGDEVRTMLEAEGAPLRPVELRGETRVFVGTREEETGRSLLLNPRGPDADPGVADRILAAVEAALDGGDRDPRGSAPRWVACCGSLLPGLPDDFYARVGELARRHGAGFVPDCDGPALAAAAPAATLLVPNEMEAGRLLGCRLERLDEIAECATALRDRGADRVAITLGSRGAVLRDGTGGWWARAELPADLEREAADGSAVGAGDAFLASLLLEPAAEAGGEALGRAVAAGTAVLLGRGTDLLDPGDVSRVRPHVRVERLG